MIDVRVSSSRQRKHGPPDVFRPIPTRIVKPIAVKATTIHPRMMKNFEKECSQLMLPPTTIHAAVEESQEWHRKWTLQDEEAHLNDSWRTEGAKNPSLSNSENESEYEEDLEEEREMLPAAVQSPTLRPVARQAFVPSPLLLPEVSDVAGCEGDYEPPLIPISRMSSRASSRASSPLTLHSGQSSVQSGLSGLTRDDESMISFPSVAPTMESYKEAVFHALAIHGGDSTSQAFHAALEPLAKHYDELGWDARHLTANSERVLEGMWLTLSKASFFGSLGENANGDPLYTLGRMAFDMFLPTQLVCSLQGNFNPVRIVPPEMRPCTEAEIPKNLLEEVEMGTHVLRTYNIITAFTVEPHMADYPKAPNRDVRRPIKGIMTTYGYVLPDPQVPNRLSIWFTGGQICPNNDEYDEREWKRLFGDHHHPGRTFGEKTRVLAANLLMGAQVPREMQDDGTLSYTFTRPLGGHGVAYVDVLYLDSTLRIVRGHKGTFFVFTRIPDDGTIT